MSDCSGIVSGEGPRTECDCEEAPLRDDMTSVEDESALRPQRCRTCRWWFGDLRAPGPGEPGRRRCGRLVDSSGLTHGSTAVALDDAGIFASLWTTQVHGCTLWEETRG